MALFEIPKRNTKEKDLAIAKKAATRKQTQPTVKLKGGNSLVDRISTIKATLETNLGKYKEEYVLITDVGRLHRYIDVCLQDGVVSIDTETDGLDPILNNIAGICIYSPSNRAAYIPINHISYITNQKTVGQIGVEDVRKEFERLIEASVDIIMFNAKFDIRVLRNQVGLKDVYCTWDAFLAARLLNENEPSNALKKLHQKYVLDDKETEFRFDELFKGIPFTMIPMTTAYLYAAHDAIITYELYQFQKQYLREDTDREDMKRVYWVFQNIEMPCVSVVADMEDNGVLFDVNYAKELSVKYNAKLKEVEDKFAEVLKTYEAPINKYLAEHPDAKVDTPINIASPAQVAILLYDILGVQSVDKKQPRGTGEAILKKIGHPIVDVILEYREVSKLINTYIDKLPECVNPKDGRIHCSFNQYGADTGRFSSSDPNLQNIPSHNKDIRKVFVASDGYLLMSSDFSQQEPKTLAAMCRKNGDSQMYDTFMQGKDLYSEIASKAFNVPYEACLEHNPDGTTNKEGKERRTQSKSILLGVLYGRGVPSIAEQLKTTPEKAQDIKNSVFRAFPAIEKFEQDSLDMAYELGYVTTVCGRKRRLPDLHLPEFEFKWKDGAPHSADLLDFDEEISDEVPEEIQEKWLKKLRRAKPWDKRAIFEQANKEDGVWIVDNGAKIADAERQCVNARIQGGAADLTKLAMIDLGKNEELKRLGFRLLIPVHDEVIAECPKENIKECSELLAQTMSKAAERILEMPIRCDVEITKEWYGDELMI